MNRKLFSSASHKPLTFVSPAMLAVAYALLIVFGSLYPFSGWRFPAAGMLDYLVAPWPKYITRSDITTNILAYLPLGVLVTAALRQRYRLVTTLFFSMLAGAVLSLLMETLQGFLPSRIASYLDILTNSSGALAGAMLTMLVASQRENNGGLVRLRAHWFIPGDGANTGIAILMLGVLAQPFPLAPVLDPPALFPAFFNWYGLHDATGFNFGLALLYALNLVSLGALAVFLKQPVRRTLPLLLWMLAVAILFKFAVALLFIKNVVLIKPVSAEALSGLLAAVFVSAWLPRRRLIARLYSAALAIAVAFVAMRLGLAEQALPLRVLGWAQLFNIAGFVYMLSLAWPFVALTYLAVCRVRLKNIRY